MPLTPDPLWLVLFVAMVGAGLFGFAVGYFRGYVSRVREVAQRERDVEARTVPEPDDKDKLRSRYSNAAAVDLAAKYETGRF